MRRISAMVFALCMLIAPLPSSAAEMASGPGKDLCLLYSQGCPNQSLSYQEKIARFQEEIAKGTQVYSAAELQRLNDKLKDTEVMFDNLRYSPSHGHGGCGHR